MATHEPAQTGINDFRVTLTVHELAELLGVGRGTAYRIARTIGFRAGRHLRISRAEVAALMSQRAEEDQS